MDNFKPPAPFLGLFIFKLDLLSPSTKGQLQTENCSLKALPVKDPSRKHGHLRPSFRLTTGWRVVASFTSDD